MANDPAPVALPSRPVSYEEAVAVMPEVRQSLLSLYDSCPLQALFDMRHAWRVSSTPRAVGILAHRAFAECLTTMKAQKEGSIPVAEALEILYEVAEQRDVPIYDRAHVPTRDWAKLRLAVVKFAKDQRFTIERLVAVERQLRAEVPVTRPDGSRGTRTLTGRIDALSFDPPDGAIILDWKTDWRPPPEPRLDPDDDEEYASSEIEAERRLSWEGYFQQRCYGYLVLSNFTNLSRVTLREVYVIRNVVREATIYRSDLERVERELALLIQAFDESMMAGPKHAGTGNARDPWVATPGKQCGYCAKAAECPIDPEYRDEGAISNPAMAGRYAAELQVATRVRKHHWKALKAWCAIHGWVALRDSKGRSVIGFNIKADGSSRFEVFTPENSDKGPLAPDLEDSRLADALRASAAEGSRQSALRKRGRKKKRDALV